MSSRASPPRHEAPRQRPPGRVHPAWWSLPALVLAGGLVHSYVSHGHPWEEHGHGHGQAAVAEAEVPHRLDVTAGAGGLEPVRLQGEADRFYSVRVSNTGAVPLNWALVAPGAEARVTKAHAGGSDLLGHPAVLGTTGDLGPGESGIVAVAPQQEGDYTYLCLPRAACGDVADGVVTFR